MMTTGHLEKMLQRVSAIESTQSWRSVFLPLECFPAKLIPVKLVLARKEVSELEMVPVYWCQKNVSQEIFLLATQKDKESREQREGMSQSPQAISNDRSWLLSQPHTESVRKGTHSTHTELPSPCGTSIYGPLFMLLPVPKKLHHSIAVSYFQLISLSKCQWMETHHCSFLVPFPKHENISWGQEEGAEEG